MITLTPYVSELCYHRAAMRADRLLKILLLLQGRGAMTGEAIARSCAVSARTVYRDMVALGAAGFPICAEAGPSGGYRLLPGYRPELTGLTRDEVAALGLLSVPAAAAHLGLSEPLRRALAKIFASVPRFSDSRGELFRARVLIDPGSPAAPADGILERIQEALLSNHRLSVRRRLPFGLAVSGAVEPVGLVFHGGSWHLLYRQNGYRVLDVGAIVEARVLDTQFPTDPAFDLEAAWRSVARTRERARSAFPFGIRLAPRALARARGLLGDALRPVDPGPPHAVRRRLEAPQPGERTVYPDIETWPQYHCASADIESARDLVLSLGGACQVLWPVELVSVVADYAAQIAARYTAPPSP